MITIFHTDDAHNCFLWFESVWKSDFDDEGAGCRQVPMRAAGTDAVMTWPSWQDGCGYGEPQGPHDAHCRDIAILTTVNLILLAIEWQRRPQ
jgi:hypothetical protein